jgi:hypothetical protein
MIINIILFLFSLYYLTDHTWTNHANSISRSLDKPANHMIHHVPPRYRETYQRYEGTQDTAEIYNLVLRISLSSFSHILGDPLESIC